MLNAKLHFFSVFSQFPILCGNWMAVSTGLALGGSIAWLLMEFLFDDFLGWREILNWMLRLHLNDGLPAFNTRYSAYKEQTLNLK